MQKGGDDWLSKGVGGFVWSHVERLALHHMEASDARRMESIDARVDVDDDGLPVGTIPAEFVGRRQEAHLVYPGARELYRRTERGTGSTLARILAFDNPPAAELSAGYVAAATPAEVLDWYTTELQHRGWNGADRRSSRELDKAYQLFTRTRGREQLLVRIPYDPSARAILQHHGAPPMQPGEVFFSVVCKIMVVYRDEVQGHRRS